MFACSRSPGSPPSPITPLVFCTAESRCNGRDGHQGNLKAPYRRGVQLAPCHALWPNKEDHLKTAWWPPPFLAQIQVANFWHHQEPDCCRELSKECTPPWDLLSLRLITYNLATSNKHKFPWILMQIQPIVLRGDFLLQPSMSKCFGLFAFRAGRMPAKSLDGKIINSSEDES